MSVRRLQILGNQCRVSGNCSSSSFLLPNFYSISPLKKGFTTSGGHPSSKPSKLQEVRSSFKHFATVDTRWRDNDIYGHVNNVVYYEYFDTLVNRFLIEKGGLDIEKGEVIGVVVETFCQFHESLTFPETIEGGLRVSKLGKSSVRYEIGIFRKNLEAAAAVGHFVHVFVDRSSRKPTEIPPTIRAALESIRVHHHQKD